METLWMGFSVCAVQCRMSKGKIWTELFRANIYTQKPEWKQIKFKIKWKNVSPAAGQTGGVFGFFFVIFSASIVHQFVLKKRTDQFTSRRRNQKPILQRRTTKQAKLWTFYIPTNGALISFRKIVPYIIDGWNGIPTIGRRLNRYSRSAAAAAADACADCRRPTQQSNTDIHPTEQQKFMTAVDSPFQQMKKTRSKKKNAANYNCRFGRRAAQQRHAQ